MPNKRPNIEVEKMIKKTPMYIFTTKTPEASTSGVTNSIRYIRKLYE